MEPPQLSNDQLRRLKWKHKRIAFMRSLGATLLFGFLIYIAAWMKDLSFEEHARSNSVFFLLAFFGTFWAQFRWLDFKAGIGPEAPDPNDYDGP